MTIVIIGPVTVTPNDWVADTRYVTFGNWKAKLEQLDELSESQGRDKKQEPRLSEQSPQDQFRSDTKKYAGT